MRQRLQWTWNRLSLMSFSEIFFRLKRAAGQIYEKRRVSKGWRPRPKERIRPLYPLFSHDLSLLDKCKSLNDSEREAVLDMLNGHIDLFGTKGLNVGRPTNWHKDHYSGKPLPLIHGKSIDYQNPDQVGNIKFVWELGRHQHLIPVALAYAVSGRKDYLDYCLSEIDNFIEQNPFGFGVHWCSALEVGLRVLSWCFVYSFIALKNGPEALTEISILPERVRQGIYEHIWFVQNHLSRHSSANNHLIGELTCIWVGCNVFDLGTEGHKWKEYSKEQLEKEAKKQNFSDGVNKEQSTYYHFWVLEYLFLSYLVGLRTKNPLSESFYQIIIKMHSFLEAIQDRSGNIPQFGDADDGTVSRFSLSNDKNPIEQVMQSVLAFQDGAKDYTHPKAFWYAAIAGKRLNLELAPKIVSKAYPIEFEQGGYKVFGSLKTHCVFKCGSHGYLSIAAHAHADALSVYFSVHGREFLIDPGTYAYHAHQKWRDYFRGTSAHNTVQVDGYDQSVMGGNFMWLKKAEARCELFETAPDKDKVKGLHNGYLRLKDPVLHRRTLELDKKWNKLTIEDHLECQERHKIERFWHFSESCSLWQDEYSIWVENQGVKICLECSDGELKLVRGEEDSPLGWISRKYGHKEPIWSAVYKNNILGSAVLKTYIYLYE